MNSMNPILAQTSLMPVLLGLALEQEMRARVAEMRACVVEAEALVPNGMAAAFRSGNLGSIGWYRSDPFLVL